MRRQRAIDLASHLLATAVVTALVVLAVVLFDAPTWAWVGIGGVVWLQQIQVPSRRRA